MKVNVVGLWTVLVTLAVGISAARVQAQAPGQIPTGYAYYNLDSEKLEPTPAGQSPASSQACGCESGTCDGSCNGACNGDCGWGTAGIGGFWNRPRQVFIGADWIHLRADVSDGTAFVERDAANAVDTFHTYDFDYNSSYRLFGGVRLDDCCGELLLSYARYRSEANLVSPDATASRQFNAAFEVNAITPGSRITTDVDVEADIYDADFARTLPLGSALGDCSCHWCPAWDVKWFFGVRYADVDWTRDSITTDPNAQNITARTVMEFDGAGPRVGVEGRRYIGRNGNFSVFAKGAISALLGDVDYVTSSVTSTPGVFPTQRASFTRIIPVVDIEVGGAVHVSDNLTISGGYMLSAWHDLGMGDQYFATLTPIFYDDANILGFDGAFVRGELAY